MKNDDLVERIYAQAKEHPQRVAFPEAEDEKMLTAAYRVATEGYATCLLIGNPAELQALCERLGFDASVFTYVDMADEAHRDELIERYLARSEVIMGRRALVRKMRRPLYFALVMQALGEADVTIGGFSATTGEVIEAALTIIGMEEGVDTVSSVTLGETPGLNGPEGRFLAMGDCAVCPNPTASQLASIAISSCDTVRSLTGWEPRCAMLSFSSDGSAVGELVDKVVEATRIAQERRPDLKIDGEMQLDTAILPATAAKKMHRPSEVAGRANILIYPDLNAGNIAGKVFNFVAGTQFTGVLLQGFKQVCCDSSRSASVEELVRNIVFSAVRAANLAAARESQE